MQPINQPAIPLKAIVLLVATGVTCTEGACDKSMLPVVKDAVIDTNTSSLAFIDIIDGSSTKGSNKNNNTHVSSSRISPAADVATVEEGYVTGYQCNQSFTTVGSPRFVCKNGAFVGNFQCIRTKCANLSSPLNGQLFNISFSNNSIQVSFQCDRDFFMLGQSTLKCGSDGEWHPSLPSCKPLKCGKYPERAHGSISHNLITGKDTSWDGILQFKLFCHQGYILNDQGITNCTDDGKWEPKRLGSCKSFTSCPVTEGLSNNIVQGLLENIYPEYEYHYKCVKDLSISQVGTEIKCFENNTWSNLHAGCYSNCKIDPGKLTKDGALLLNFTRNHAFVLHGQYVEWTCTEGYQQSSDLNYSSIMLCYDGQLSSFPVCKRVEDTNTSIETHNRNVTSIGNADETTVGFVIILVIVVCFVILVVIVVIICVCYKRHQARRGDTERNNNVRDDISGSVTIPEQTHTNNSNNFPMINIDPTASSGCHGNEDQSGETDDCLSNGLTCSTSKTDFETGEEPSTRISKRRRRSDHRYNAIKKRISWFRNDVIIEDGDNEFKCNSSISGAEKNYSPEERLESDIVTEKSQLGHMAENPELHTQTNDAASFKNKPQCLDKQNFGSNKASIPDEEQSRAEILGNGTGKYTRKNKPKERYFTAKDVESADNDAQGSDASNDELPQGNTSTSKLLEQNSPKTKNNGRKGQKSRYKTAKTDFTWEDEIERSERHEHGEGRERHTDKVQNENVGKRKRLREKSRFKTAVDSPDMLKNLMTSENGSGTSDSSE